MDTSKDTQNPTSTTRQLGSWSALVTAILAALFFVIGLFGSSYTEGITYPYVLTTIRPIDYLLWIPAFLLPFSLIILFSCLHTLTPSQKKVFSHIGLSFGIVYATIMLSDLFLQWTVILPSIAHNETSTLSLLSQYYPHGVFLALESLGYLLLDTALLFFVPTILGTSRLHRAIRWLFLAAFSLTTASFLIVLLTRNNIVVFEVIAITINVIVLISIGILLSRMFAQTPSGQPI